MRARVRFLVVRLEVVLPAAAAAAAAVQMSPPSFAVFTIFPIFDVTLPTLPPQGLLKMMRPRPCSSARSASFALYLSLSLPLALSRSVLEAFSLLLIKCVVRATYGETLQFLTII